MSFHLLTKGQKRPKNALPVARVRGGELDNAILFHTDDDTGTQLIDLPDGEFTPMPDPRPGRRCVYHIVGASGAGKSTVAADFAENFAEMYPNNKTIIISGDEAEDPAFEGVDHERVKASVELNEIPINELCADVDGTLLIFDDVEAIPDKADRLALESFQGRALTTGRKHNAHVLSLVHRGADGKATKTSLLESNGLIVFPKHAGGANLRYMLETHFGLPAQIKDIIKDGFGRWVLIRNDAEPYILGPLRAAIYDADDVAGALKSRKLVDKKIMNKQAEAQAADALQNLDDLPGRSRTLTFRKMMGRQGF